MEKTSIPPHINVLTCSGWDDYMLLDSGNGYRLERFGKTVLIRPEAEAIWKPALSEKQWSNCHARFQPSAEEMGGHWQIKKTIPSPWVLSYKKIKFLCQLSGSKQIGVFPEQSVQWDWISEQIAKTHRPLNILNLFGYTGIASLCSAAPDTKVTHVDASKKVVSWAKENQALSGLDSLSIRWIVDDVIKFVQREVRRGVKYDGIILDPPKFGRGPKGEVWEFYKLIPNLLSTIQQVLSSKPEFIVLTAYAVKASALTLLMALDEMMKSFSGQTECGEVVLKDNSVGHLLSTSIYGRWSHTHDTNH